MTVSVLRSLPRSTEPFSDVRPLTLNVPATTVLPVAAATVNLFVLTSKSPSTPKIPPIDASSSTTRSSVDLKCSA